MSRSPLRHAAAAVLALAATAAPAAASPQPGTYGARLGGHAMLYLNTPPELQRAMFRATAEAGVRHLRMDFAIGIVFAGERPDFSAVDGVDALAAEYGLDVLGVITTTPGRIAECPGGATVHLDRCAPAARYERRWSRMVARVVRHAPHVRLWELGNEPDNGFGRDGHEYARWAAPAAQGIRAARPDAVIAFGGLAHAYEPFVAQALHDPSHPLLGLVDIANIHLRGSLSSLPEQLAVARAGFLRHGLGGQVWVTESGYPSRPEHQREPGFQGGPRDQARWLVRAARSLVQAGAGRIFFTFRDTREFGRDSPFSSEGILLWPRLDRDGRARPKPAFWALRRLARQSCGC